MPLILAKTLKRLTSDLCGATGSPQEEADRVAELLVGANLAGHDSHGVARLGLYMTRVGEGRLVPGAGISVLSEDEGTVSISGNWGYGQMAATQTMAYAIDKARSRSVVVAGLRETNHLGRLSDYVLMAADAGRVGLMFTNAGGFSKLVAPYGGATRRMSTNPLAIAFPSASKPHVCMDMSTACVSEGKVAHWKAAGTSAPPDTILDPEGKATTDPSTFYEGGAILSLGGPYGHKGFVLNFAIEILAGVLTGAGYLREEVDRFSNGSLMILIDPAAFGPAGALQLGIQDLVDYLKASPEDESGNGILVPGEREAAMAEQRSVEGIDIPPETWSMLVELCSKSGVSVEPE
ncbi:MAG: hypothetical protein CME19_18385 [Gemmatimonadetes bacterium]|nr:hypothetical protein [Gemmatimonadota bacterium]